MQRPRRRVVVLCGAVATACASHVDRASLANAPPGHQQLEVLVTENIRVPFDAPVHEMPGSVRMEPLGGVTCVLRNAKGTWEVAAPGKVVVALSPDHLAIECRKEGYATVSGRAPCQTPKGRATREGLQAGLLLVQVAGPLAMAAAAPVGAFAAGSAAAVAGGAAAGAASETGPGAEACDYSPTGKLQLFLWRDGRSPGPGR